MNQVATRRQGRLLLLLLLLTWCNADDCNAHFCNYTKLFMRIIRLSN